MDYMDIMREGATPGETCEEYAARWMRLAVALAETHPDEAAEAAAKVVGSVTAVT